MGKIYTKAHCCNYCERFSLWRWFLFHPYQSGTKMNVAIRVAEWHLSSSTSPQGIWAPMRLFGATQEVSHIGLKIESSRIWNKVGAFEHNPLTVCDTGHSSPAYPWDVRAISWSPPKNVLDRYLCSTWRLAPFSFLLQGWSLCWSGKQALIQSWTAHDYA